ncbi:alpha/beta fold hydrolase [Xanthomonas perforans]|uniref:Alpha/beta fold hydrolase n=1 Tax=Xanthomonas euvesicatoria TaxID=456327 RepID=A0AAX4FG37_XANEU|nr:MULTISPECIES: alpha/beta fold hydrolase [Xanthomonas]MBV6783711.1 alpha/beta fold hydrolase [Xanthomonas campestris pv. uppalii]MBV6856868.1 alpha/beta fold hydrolase [Xanthomonas campestris pv. zingibericola]MCP3038201.1 alpha/beta fold hydrolase [Xanthomonas euvesicatoria pv. allii]MCP3050113.1 alpha/beta fold hydrolase [Xanthomonas euvesicatoria pv. allii]WOP47084.1 alpha/beta fold hydrolase [Xanthomonas euvesicatoria]
MPSPPAVPTRVAASADASSGTLADVLLVHGIWNSPLWLLPLARRLRQGGYRPALFGYASVLGGPAQAVPQLIARLRATGVQALVCHSLGGLIAAQALRSAPDLPVRRVVCLGSPLAGSSVARGLARRGLPRAMGRSADLLQQGLGCWDGAAEIGQVAGCVPRGLGRWLAPLGEVSDGTVSLAETQLPGLRDHCVVRASHSGLLLSPAAARQTLAFLDTGRFQR